VEGLVILTLRPDLGLTQPIPWVLILLRSFSFVPAALLMLAVQTWVAIRWRSFTIAMALGIGSTVVGIMLLRSLRNIESTPYGPFLASLFPWSLPYVVIARQATTDLRETALLAGILGGVVIAAFGCWDVVHRDVA
jgi:ABC-2 type transport system permease protein